MTRLLPAVLFCIIQLAASAQPLPDSLKGRYNSTSDETTRHEIIYTYLELHRSDSSYNRIVEEFRKYFTGINDQSSLHFIEMSVTGTMIKTGDYVNGLDKALLILKEIKKENDPYGEMVALDKVAQALFFAGDYEQSLVYAKEGLRLASKSGSARELASTTNNISTTYARMQLADSGIAYAKLAIQYAGAVNEPGVLGTTFSSLAENYSLAKKYDSSILLSRKAMEIVTDPSNRSWLYANMADAFLGQGNTDSARYYAQLTIRVGAEKHFQTQLQRGYESMYRSYDLDGRQDSAYKYFKLSTELKDKQFSAQKARELNAVSLREKNREQELDKKQSDLNNRVRLYSLGGGLLLIALIAWFLFRSNRHKQKTNLLLGEQKTRLEKTLQELQATQAQLIQAEKMASLGELTAGIAHEIQNPLNFVNNFSEVSNELIVEMKEEIGKGNYEEVKAIADDLMQNLGKINHHGKRADSIVKGKLQHSRTGNGKKEPTNINELCDEYLRLAYHGLRAKDPSFNATIEADLDKTNPMLLLVAQDFGRVILNLLNNAFYAVHQKTKKNIAGYVPVVSISTRNTSTQVEIEISDNGDGIPEDIRTKVFQPFFTTKPTGQGTGLGLSLAYDIITKGHGGEITMQTESGEGTKFVIRLPKTI